MRKDEGHVFECRGREMDWRQHRKNVESAFGPELTIRLRASEVAQHMMVMLSKLVDGRHVAACQMFETFERERVAWARWAAAQPALQALLQAEESMLAPGTRERLNQLLRMAALDDAGISSFAWRTKWHDVLGE